MDWCLKLLSLQLLIGVARSVGTVSDTCWALRADRTKAAVGTTVGNIRDSVEECQEYCEGMIDCTGFIFTGQARADLPTTAGLHEPNNYCKLVGQFAPSSSAQISLGMTYGKRVDCGRRDACWTVQDDSVFASPGSPLAEESLASREECREACKEFESCTAFEYTADGVCSLYADAGEETTDEEGSVAGSLDSNCVSIEDQAPTTTEEPAVEYTIEEELEEYWDIQEDMCIDNFNKETRVNVASIFACILLCENEEKYECMSVEYYAATKSCTLSRVNRKMIENSPSKRNYKSCPGFTYAEPSESEFKK